MRLGLREHLCLGSVCVVDYRWVPPIVSRDTIGKAICLIPTLYHCLVLMSVPVTLIYPGPLPIITLLSGICQVAYL